MNNVDARYLSNFKKGGEEEKARLEAKVAELE